MLGTPNICAIQQTLAFSQTQKQVSLTTHLHTGLLTLETGRQAVGVPPPYF